MPPLDQPTHDGMEDRSFLDADPVKPELLPDRVRQLRWKLNQKAFVSPMRKVYRRAGCGKSARPVRRGGAQGGLTTPCGSLLYRNLEFIIKTKIYLHF